MRICRAYIWTLIFLGLVSLESKGQDSPLLPEKSDSELLNSFLLHDKSDQALTSRLNQKFQDHIAYLESLQSRKKSDKAFLKSIFYKTQRRILKNYDISATVDETLQTGKYGCLSGTVLYAIILMHFGFEFDIVALPDHVYILAHLDEKDIILESTLPGEGFKESVANRTDHTQPSGSTLRTNESVVAIAGLRALEKEEEKVIEIIDLDQLRGLQHYNQAVFELKEAKLSSAYDHAALASVLYPSKRTNQVMEIIINKILQSKDLTSELKSGILMSYISQVKKKKLTQR